MKEMPLTTPAPAWLAEWLARAADLSLPFSIVIGSKCCQDLQGIGLEIAHYLNEFDPQAEGHWHEFSHHDLRHLAGDPACREMILTGIPTEASDAPPVADLDRVARQIASLGGAVLEGRYSLDAAKELQTAFRVCLCSSQPICLDPCDIWINSSSFSREGLVAVIADSFLDWSARRPDSAISNITGNAQHPANGAEPDSRSCASF